MARHITEVFVNFLLTSYLTIILFFIVRRLVGPGVTLQGNLDPCALYSSEVSYNFILYFDDILICLSFAACGLIYLHFCIKVVLQRTLLFQQTNGLSYMYLGNATRVPGYPKTRVTRPFSNP